MRTAHKKVKEMIEREDRLAEIYAQPENVWRTWEYSEIEKMEEFELIAYMNICKMGVRIPGNGTEKLKRHGAICREILIARGVL